ncbi:DMT family transporter [Erythrobacteraceae bacterium CFH 75059]|nr:DMT family transporter [Erythrobacteraceae bacterium CFH 75059]
MLRPAVALPLLLVALIWGSTWIVITGQIGSYPASWSVAYRFAIAAPAMFALALLTRRSLQIGRGGHGLALLLGLFQFCGNFQFVYRAELHITSGIVAVLFSLMIVSNTVLGQLLLKERVTPRFYAGSAVALVGVALLLLHEARAAPAGGNVLLGIGLALGGILSASVANILQARPAGRNVAMASLLAWAMLYGAAFNALAGMWEAGWPDLPREAAFWLGTAWLALAGSVVTFPLYYGLIRRIGAGRAAYQNILVIIIAMLISTALEGYRWSALSVAGGLLALLGMGIALRAKSVPVSVSDSRAANPSRNVG